MLTESQHSKPVYKRVIIDSRLFVPRCLDSLFSLPELRRFYQPEEIPDLIRHILYEMVSIILDLSDTDFQIFWVNLNNFPGHIRRFSMRPGVVEALSGSEAFRNIFMSLAYSISTALKEEGVLRDGYVYYVEQVNRNFLVLGVRNEFINR